jgi:hypothetical protein
VVEEGWRGVSDARKSDAAGTDAEGFWVRVGPAGGEGFGVVVREIWSARR